MSFSSSVFALWLLGASVLLWHDVGVLGQAVTPVCVMNACTLAVSAPVSSLPKYHRAVALTTATRIPKRQKTKKKIQFFFPFFFGF
jgi:hypothetical protein